VACGIGVGAQQAQGGAGGDGAAHGVQGAAAAGVSAQQADALAELTCALLESVEVGGGAESGGASWRVRSSAGWARGGTALAYQGRATCGTG
jgi:hypothetical protein